MSFGTHLAEERRTKGYSQTFLSNLLETTQRHLSFLETGRSSPSREMVMRISETLKLDPDRRTRLFEAAGFTSPYKSRALNDAEIVQALHVIENHVLANWPYAGFAFTTDWDIVLANEPGAAMFGTTTEAIKAKPINFFDAVLTSDLRARIRNWNDVSAAFFARLRRHAVEHPKFRARLEQAVADGMFEGDFERLSGKSPIPALLPMEFDMPDGTVSRITSISAHFASVHDGIMSGIEIELMVPVT